MLERLLDRLEARYGELSPVGPREPYPLLIWLNCGYPASDSACAKGFATLQARVGVSPEAILAAPSTELAQALSAGGMVPELRAERLKQIAARVRDDHGGDLAAALNAPLAEARKVLKRFPTIGEPAADRILLFCGLAPVPVAPGGALQVPIRLGLGVEVKDWGKTYASVREALAAALPADFQALQRAYLLLKAHGQATCKRSRPLCEDCPLTADCAWFLEVVAPAALRARCDQAESPDR